MATDSARPDLHGYALEFRSTTPRIIVENGNPNRAGEAASPSRMPVNPAGSPERPRSPETDLLSGKDASSAEMEDAAHHGPRFVARDGDIEGQGSPYNQTKVDVVLVPCPGADPYDTWTRDRLPRDVFESTFDWNKPNVKARAPTLDSEMFQMSQYIDKSPSWARSGIRKEVGFARVLSYDHGDIPEAATIKQLSMNLLELLRNERQPPRKRRPLFFICHSLGGLVVKLALNLARRDPCHSATLEDCYGLTFFATPHQGLPDLFRPQSAAHIQQLLGLPKPLPASIGTELLRPDSYLLHDMNIKFREYSSDIHIWTLYESGVAQVSQASESLRYGNAGAQIKPSLTSMGSAILGLRNERIYPLRSSHTNCASFGVKNLRTMMLYIKELGNAIRKSAAFYEDKPVKSLDLEESVLIRVHKFQSDERFHHNNEMTGLASDDGDAILGEMVMNNSQPDDYDDEEEEFDILNGNILMVDQLWMWVIDNGEEDNVVTCFPGREGDPMDGPLFDEADLHNSIFNELHGNEFSPCENAFDLAALIVLHAVTILLGRSSNPDLEVFRLFDEAISLLTERITHLLKLLEASAWGGAYGLGDDLTNPNISIQEKHRQENVRARLEYRNNTSTLLALRDIEDELSIMKRLFSEQEQQIAKMISIYDKMEAAPITRGKSSLQEALAAVQSYHFRSDDMISRTRKVLLDFDRLLDLFERRTQGEEGRLARHNADLGAAQNRIMLIFTVFTVIFLPLSFFTSLFGMNTREWGGGDNLSLSTIGLIVFPTSAFLIVCAIAGAWMASGSMRYLSMERYTQMPKRWWGKLINIGVYDDNNPRTSHARRGTQRKHEATGHKRRKDTMIEEVLMLDFWDSHRLQREHDHHKIPVGNRKSTRIAMARAMAKKEKREGQGLS
ncbi:hypothetical protein VSDG_06252 [Cytospora chrysosperma]|uniref:DUF676 domain-containing protein n=1 Tax=Cytospora chrysosperma TaxID=252740 RepID=A0A423VSR8_CYTCH|nr:hypothetical protein VSDG_06252 [Valsa sordida]